jgi:hypothetical protein
MYSSKFGILNDGIAGQIPAYQGSRFWIFLCQSEVLFIIAMCRYSRVLISTIRGPRRWRHFLAFLLHQRRSFDLALLFCVCEGRLPAMAAVHRFLMPGSIPMSTLGRYPSGRRLYTSSFGSVT